MEKTDFKSTTIEELLRKISPLYTLLTDNMNGTVWIVDMNFRIKWASPSVERNHGYTIKELNAVPLKKLIAPASLQIVLQSVSEDLKTERLQKKDMDISKTFDLELYRKDGSTYWNEVKMKLLRNEEGTPIGILGLGRDIERKRVEESLQRSERRYRELYQNLRDGSVVVNMAGYITEFNPAFQNLLGYSADEIYSITYEDITPEKWHAAEKKILEEQVMKRGYSDIYEKEYRRKDGTFLPVELRSYLIRDDKGAPSGYWTFVRDITERKMAEDALTAERERLASILDGIPVPTFMIDNRHRVILWNRQNEIFTGILKENILGKPLNLNFLFQKKASPALAELVLKMGDEELMAKFGRRGLQKSDVHPHTYESIGQIWIKGKERTLAIQAARIFDSSGKVVGAVQTGQDITDRIHLEIQLHQAQKMEAIGTLAGGIAHDFNNILSAIMGYTDMALGGLDGNTEIRRYLRQVYKAGERARDLVKQILAFSRQSNELMRPVRVSPIVKEALKLLRASLPSTIRIHRDIQSEPDTILADPVHIHQILMNLCTNAAHAMHDRKGELKISLVPVEIKPGDALIVHHGLSPGMYLKLSTRDTGSGIAPDIVNRIFDPFFTTKKPGEGTGMGLSVVYGIVRGYGGTVTVESKAGKGTEFHVYFPLLMKPWDKREEKGGIPVAGRRERILFVDDEEMLVQLGKSMLAGLGYQVLGMTSSLEALELFQAGPDRFDLVITDMTMPDMTGIELAQEFMRIRPDVPIILCTGFSEAITPERVKAMGIKDFIMKPMVKKQIAPVIRRFLDRKEQ